MKGNRKSRLAQDDRGFAFIVPMTLAIVIGMALLIAGAFIIGTMTSSLEDSFGTATGRTSTENSTVSLMGNITTGFANIVDIEIVVIIITALSMAADHQMKGNKKSRLAQDDRGFAFIVPMTLAIVVGIALLIAGAFIIGTMTSSLEGNFDSNTTLRTSTENSTVSLMGNITTGFANIVDIEIVVIIITALSMAWQ